MPTSLPTYRNVTSEVGKSFEVFPKDGFAACVVVENVTEAGEPGAVLRLYVARSHSPNAAAIAYTPKGIGNFWIVDLPSRNAVPLDLIMKAIHDGDPNLPDPPVTWHT